VKVTTTGRRMIRERVGRRLKRAGSLGVLLVAVVVLVSWTTASSGRTHASALGQPPPEWAANAGSWPAHSYDLSNTRATTQTQINSHTVSGLKVKSRFAFKGASAFGDFASTPIVLNGTVYLQDLNSNVYALDECPTHGRCERG
jgi:glucose dehydrogenase